MSFRVLGRRFIAAAAPLLYLLLPVGADAQSTSAAGDQALVLAKEGTGPITKGSVALSLRTVPPCDQTQSLIPDGSRLVSDNFSLLLDDKGIGTFRGNAKVLTPDGRTVLEGLLHGTAGLFGSSQSAKDCRAPGHLEGMLESLAYGPVPLEAGNGAAGSSPGGAPARGGNDPSTGSFPAIITPVIVLEIHFSADERPELAGPLPVFQAHLEGLATVASPPPPPPPIERVQIAPGRLLYDTKDPVTALITNGSSQSIRVFDERSYCTIVQLQRQDRTGWIEVAGCPLGRIPLPTIIPPGESKKILLPPDPNTPAAKDAGVYRLALTFTSLDTSGNPVGDPRTVISTTFLVGTTPPPPPPPPPGTGVKLQTDRIVYASSDRIIGAVLNETDQTLLTSDHRSFCSLVKLQRKGRDGWVDVAPCLLMFPTVMTQIGPRQGVKVLLPPEPQSPRFEAGTYRLELEYVLIDKGAASTGPPLLVVDSPIFFVGLSASVGR